MALVKFTRADGHPAIEIKALDATEEAFLAEFVILKKYNNEKRTNQTTGSSPG